MVVQIEDKFLRSYTSEEFSRPLSNILGDYS